MNSKELESFRKGKGLLRPLATLEQAMKDGALSNVGNYLRGLEPENSFAWTEEQPTRQSFWVVCGEALSSRLTIDAKLLQQYDGDREAGQRGIDALIVGPGPVVDSIEYLTRLAQSHLVETAYAIGVTHELLSTMHIRLRFVAYTGDHPGIGTHFDGNFLSAVVTNRYGLVELGYDGSVTWVSPSGVSVMAGSSAYRVTEGGERMLPTFHLVPPSKGEPKMSVAAFLNFPDKTTMWGAPFGAPGNWFHDVNAMKNDDGPSGSLGHLWERQAQALGISMKKLAAGEVPGV